ncbi:MAG: hypothetical protein H6828_15080 [Planctomycetes bacterium]|nr:hypothetical protein [Planctomycetota bacterium]
MNTSTDQPGTPVRFRVLSALAGIALASLLGFGLLNGDSLARGSDDGRPDDNGHGSDDGHGGDFSSDDEVIGTLPMIGGDDDDDEALLALILASEQPPAFYVEAPAAELLRGILAAGPGAFAESAFTTYEFVPTARHGLGNLRITFHGDVEVGFDSSFLDLADVRFGLALGWGLDTFGAGVVYEGRVVSTTLMQSGDEFHLPLGTLHQQGLLDRVQILTSNGRGTRSLLRAEERGGLVTLGQSVDRPGALPRTR